MKSKRGLDNDDNDIVLGSENITPFLSPTLNAKVNNTNI